MDELIGVEACFGSSAAGSLWHALTMLKKNDEMNLTLHCLALM